MFAKASLETLSDNAFADLRPYKKVCALNFLNLTLSKGFLETDSSLKPIIEHIKVDIFKHLETLSLNKPSIASEFIKLIHHIWPMLNKEVSLIFKNRFKIFIFHFFTFLLGEEKVV